MLLFLYVTSCEQAGVLAVYYQSGINTELYRLTNTTTVDEMYLNFLRSERRRRCAQTSVLAQNLRGNRAYSSCVVIVIVNSIAKSITREDITS